jgi:hypothetical protein
MYAIDSLDDYVIGLPLDDADEMKKIAEEFVRICPDISDQFHGCVIPKLPNIFIYMYIIERKPYLIIV